MQKTFLKALAVLAAGFLFAGCASTQNNTAQKYFQNLPPGCDPKFVGERVVTNFLARKIYTINDKVVYPEICVSFGALRFTDAAGDKALEQKLVDRYAYLMTPEGAKQISTDRHVDFHVFGVLPLEIFLLTGSTPHLALGLHMADDQWVDPLENGLCRETRWWVDDCFMIGTLQIQAYRATHDAKYVDRLGLELAAYLDKLQQPNGLFFHADVSHHFWGRGNGWFAAALAEVLSSMPPEHPKYARLMAGYKKMMAGLKKHQAPSGLWRQLVDNDKSWDETSCTGMFTYAMITGVKHGWLDASYGDVARRGWIGLCKNIDDNANLREVCVGTNQKDDVQYYLDRPRVAGDPHGQAPLLWCAWALLEK